MPVHTMDCEELAEEEREDEQLEPLAQPDPGMDHEGWMEPPDEELDIDELMQDDAEGIIRPQRLISRARRAGIFGGTSATTSCSCTTSIRRLMQSSGQPGVSRPPRATTRSPSNSSASRSGCMASIGRMLCVWSVASFSAGDVERSCRGRRLCGAVPTRICETKSSGRGGWEELGERASSRSSSASLGDPREWHFEYSSWAANPGARPAALGLGPFHTVGP